MKAVHIEQEKQGRFLKCMPLSLLFRAGKKYIIGFVAIQFVVIWFIYSKSNELWPLFFNSTSTKIKSLDCLLSNATVFHIPLTDHKDMIPFYIEINRNVWCFKNGIDIKASKTLKQCKCFSHWYGLDCGIPEAVWYSSYLEQGQKQSIQIRRRSKPRRIISSVLFVNEFDLLDINVHESFHAVDLFLIVEQESFRPPSLLQKLKMGFLSEFQSKIMPFSINKLNNKFDSLKEWSIFMVSNLWFEGWKHVTDFRPDDIFIFSHVSSILSKDILLFLKLYDGYPEPFLFKLRPLLYQFQRYIAGNQTFIQTLTPFAPMGCSFQYLHIVCKYDFIKLFNNACLQDMHTKQSFENNFWKLEDWTVGTDGSPSGWQCNWCCRSSEIKNALRSKILIDKNLNISAVLYLDENNTSTIDHLIKQGKWLDGSYLEVKLLAESESHFAPNIVLSNPHKYSFLIND